MCNHSRTPMTALSWYDGLKGSVVNGPDFCTLWRFLLSLFCLQRQPRGVAFGGGRAYLPSSFCGWLCSDIFHLPIIAPCTRTYAQSSERRRLQSRNVDGGAHKHNGRTKNERTGNGPGHAKSLAPKCLPRHYTKQRSIKLAIANTPPSAKRLPS